MPSFDAAEVRSYIDFERELRAMLPTLSRPSPSGEARALCPFHPDTNPSLNVNVRSGVYWCPVCHARGDVFTLYQQRTGATFPATLEYYAARYGLAARTQMAVAATNGDARSQWREAAVYDYRDETGALLYQSVRQEQSAHNDGTKPTKRFRQRRPDGRGGSIANLDGVRRVLYRLPEIIEAVAAERTIYIGEGEKAVAALVAAGLAATCNSGGAGQWRPDFSEHLRDAHVVILPDNDERGRYHAEQVASSLHGVASSVKIVNLTNLPEKGDAVEYFAAGGIVEQLQQLVDDTVEWSAGEPIAPPEEAPSRRRSQGEILLELAESWECCVSQDGEAYVIMENGGLAPINSEIVRNELARRFAEADGKAPGSGVLRDVLNVLAGRAMRGNTRKVYRRIGELDGNIIVDLCNESFRVITITPNGWIMGPCPAGVYFYRPAGMLPLPEAVRGGTMDELRPFLNTVQKAMGHSRLETTERYWNYLPEHFKQIKEPVEILASVPAQA